MKHGVSLKLRLMRKKPIDDMVEDGSVHGNKPGRSITLFQLTMFGVGTTIGTGIFFMLSAQVPVATLNINVTL